LGWTPYQKEREENATGWAYSFLYFSSEQEASAVITASFPFISEKAGWIGHSLR